MTTEDKTMEFTILQAATKVFLEKGFDGARMQEIADKARINKSLLHYYFRSKEMLFKAVFQEALMQFLPRINDIIASDISLFDKIQVYVDTYITMLTKNPHLPMFILHELNRHPIQLLSNMQGFGLRYDRFIHDIELAATHGEIRRIDPRQLLVNMTALCIFPFVGKSIIKGLIFNNETKAYDDFLDQRKKEVNDFIIHAISIQK